MIIFRILPYEARIWRSLASKIATIRSTDRSGRTDGRQALVRHGQGQVAEGVQQAVIGPVEVFQEDEDGQPGSVGRRSGALSPEVFPRALAAWPTDGANNGLG